MPVPINMLLEAEKRGVVDVLVLPPGFEPGSLARKARMIGRSTLRERRSCE